MPKDRPSRDDILRVVDYDAQQGMFLWRAREGFYKTIGRIAGKTDSCGYRRINVNGKSHQAAWVVWFLETGAWPKEEIDHINGIRNDDRFCNLREATRVQNCINRVRSVKVNKYGYRGVKSRRDATKFSAAITVNKKSIHLGYFDSPKLAAHAYDDAARKYHCEFARLNFPDKPVRDWLLVSSAGFRCGP